MKYRVHYPMCQDDQYRDFLTRAEAEKFARERQKILDLSPAYFNIHSWRTVWIEEIKRAKGPHRDRLRAFTKQAAILRPVCEPSSPKTTRFILLPRQGLPQVDGPRRPHSETSD